MAWSVVGVPLAVAYAAVAAAFDPLSWPAMLATVPPLLVAIGAALRAPSRPGGAPIGFGRMLPWLLVVAVGTAWELIALFGSPRADFPTVSSLVSPLAGSPWFRFAGYLIWFGAGAWLARRWRTGPAGQPAR